MNIRIGDYEVEYWWDDGFKRSLTPEIVEFVKSELSKGVTSGEMGREDCDTGEWAAGQWRAKDSGGGGDSGDDDDDMMMFGFLQGWFS